MKIVFAKYTTDESGKKNYKFTAYRKFSYFGKFNDFGKWGFWYQNVDGWMFSMDDVYGDSLDMKVRNFEDKIRKLYDAKVIWINASLMAYKLSNGKTVIR